MSGYFQCLVSPCDTWLFSVPCRVTVDQEATLGMPELFLSGGTNDKIIIIIYIYKKL